MTRTHEFLVPLIYYTALFTYLTFVLLLLGFTILMFLEPPTWLTNITLEPRSMILLASFLLFSLINFLFIPIAMAIVQFEETQAQTRQVTYILSRTLLNETHSDGKLKFFETRERNYQDAL